MKSKKFWTKKEEKEYGKPLLVYGEPKSKEVFVFWRTETDVWPAGGVTYTITVYNPEAGEGKRIGYLNVHHSDKGERMAHVEIDKKYKGRGLASALSTFSQLEFGDKRMWLASEPGKEVFHEKMGYKKTGRVFSHQKLPVMEREPGTPEKKIFIKPPLTLSERLKKLFRFRR